MCGGCHRASRARVQHVPKRKLRSRQRPPQPEEAPREGPSEANRVLPLRVHAAPVRARVPDVHVTAVVVVHGRLECGGRVGVCPRLQLRLCVVRPRRLCLRHALRVLEVFVGSICLTALTPTEKTSCLSRELQQEKLVVVDLRHGVSRGCCSDKYFSTDSQAAVNYFGNTEAV